jgi:glycosyltransferase involved in cell wall biosynthesis
VCIDARLADGVPGGIQQELVGLAAGLSGLTDGEEEYLFLAEEGSTEWLVPHLGGRCRLATCRCRGWKASARRFVPRRLDRLALWGASFLPVEVPPSNGLVEGTGARVVHFALQQGLATEVPSIYTPQDLQHRHFPGFFSRHEITWREAMYPALCRQAARVVALSRWGKRDLAEQFGLDEGKVHVIGLAPAVDAYPVPGPAEIEEARSRLGLPDAFAYYPAQTFVHKNHLRLLEAVALLRARHGVEVPLVCSGRLNDHYPEIEKSIRRLGLGSLARFIGFVRPADVQALYARARMVVFPSLFEGFGMPVLEAYRADVPVACSRATSLPEVAGEAALLFDPESVEDMALAMRRVWTEPELRRTLVVAGHGRLAGVSWDGIARKYRALYRLVAGWPLAEADRALLREAE